MANTVTKKQKILNVFTLSTVAVIFAILPTTNIFAEESTGSGIMKHEDELTINILPVCTLGLLDGGNIAKQYPPVESTTSNVTPSEATAVDDNTTHGDNSWTIGTNVTGNTTSGLEGYRTDTFAQTMLPGQERKNLTTTIFNIRCNNSNGYSLSAIGNGVGASVTDLVAADGNKIETSTGESWTGTSDSYWSMYVSATSDGSVTAQNNYGSVNVVPATDTVIAKKTTAGDIENGETITVTYGAGININQPSGSYSGAVLYTLAQLDSDDSTLEETENTNNPEGTGTNKSEQNVDPESKKSVDDGTAEKINDLEQKVNDLSNQLNSLSSPSYTTINNYNNYGGDTIISNSTPTSTETPVSTAPNPSTTGTNATEGLAGAKGVSSKSGSGTKEVESSDNTGLIIALVALGATATVATGAYFYMKDKEEE